MWLLRGGVRVRGRGGVRGRRPADPVVRGGSHLLNARRRWRFRFRSVAGRRYAAAAAAVVVVAVAAGTTATIRRRRRLRPQCRRGGARRYTTSGGRFVSVFPSVVRYGTREEPAISPTERWRVPAAACVADQWRWQDAGAERTTQTATRAKYTINYYCIFINVRAGA